MAIKDFLSLNRRSASHQAGVAAVIDADEFEQDRKDEGWKAAIEESVRHVQELEASGRNR